MYSHNSGCACNFHFPYCTSLLIGVVQFSCCVLMYVRMYVCTHHVISQACWRTSWAPSRSPPLHLDPCLPSNGTTKLPLCPPHPQKMRSNCKKGPLHLSSLSISRMIQKMSLAEWHRLTAKRLCSLAMQRWLLTGKCLQTGIRWLHHHGRKLPILNHLDHQQENPVWEQRTQSLLRWSPCTHLF